MKKKSFIVGVDLGGTNTKIALISPSKKIVDRTTFYTALYKNKQGLIKRIADEVKNIITANKISLGDVKGVGLGLPGLIDPTNGIVFKLINIPGWKNVPLKKILENKLNLPVSIDNDVNATCLAEFLYGAGKGSKNMVAVSLGTGVGAGIIINSSLYRGSSFSAGEFGHIQIDKNGPRCGCGNNGCLESFCGNYAIIRRAKSKIKRKKSTILSDKIRDLTPYHLSQAAKKGDAIALETWRDIGNSLGVGLSFLVNVLNPERIVICGGVSNSGKYLMRPLISSLKKNSLSVPYNKVKVVFSKLGQDVGVIGAASLVSYASSKK